MHVYLYAFALFCGIATVRATSIMDRRGVRDPNRIFSMISGLSLFASFALIGLGFVLYEWWVPIVTAFATALLVGVLVIRATHAFFYRAVPVTGLVAIVVCVRGWFTWAGI